MKAGFLSWLLRGYTLLLFVFVFAPIFFSVVFSFNSARFPTIPLESFTLHWYQTIWADPDVWTAVGNSVVVSLCTSVIATILGFVRRIPTIALTSASKVLIWRWYFYHRRFR